MNSDETVRETTAEEERRKVKTKRSKTFLEAIFVEERSSWSREERIMNVQRSGVSVYLKGSITCKITYSFPEFGDYLFSLIIKPEKVRTKGF